MIRLPAMPEKQQAAWHALFEIHQAYPTHWTLIGGQAVYLHAIDRKGGHDALARLQQLAKDWNPADPNDRF